MLIRIDERRRRQRERRNAPFSGFLAVLLLILLSGLPQIGISLTGIDPGGERLIPVPLTRSLLLDKLPPEVSALMPPQSSGLALVVVAPPPLSPPLSQWSLVAESPKPGEWLLNLTRRLYRHHSSYV
jgi:hypothetical protein